MMSVSPSGHATAGDGVEPSPSGVKARRSTAELPRHLPIPANKRGQGRVTPGLEGPRSGRVGVTNAEEAWLAVPWMSNDSDA